MTLNMIPAYHRLVGMPRVAAIEHPFGRPYGDVGDAERQRAVILAALEFATKAAAPGEVVHLPFRWHQEPSETHWHPAEPSPIIGLMKERAAKRAAKEAEKEAGN
ncbi:MAG: hypothetical protein AB8G23_20825 [Myxococcota bacterium]